MREIKCHVRVVPSVVLICLVRLYHCESKIYEKYSEVTNYMAMILISSIRNLSGLIMIHRIYHRQQNTCYSQRWQSLRLHRIILIFNAFAYLYEFIHTFFWRLPIRNNMLSQSRPKGHIVNYHQYMLKFVICHELYPTLCHWYFQFIYIIRNQ